MGYKRFTFLEHSQSSLKDLNNIKVAFKKLGYDHCDILKVYQDMYNKVIDLNDLIVNSPDCGIFKVLSEEMLLKIVDLSTKLTEINSTLYKININVINFDSIV